MTSLGSRHEGSGTLIARIPETVAWVDVDGEAVLFDEVTQSVHVLNPTATLVWSGIDGQTTLERIARELSESFGADPTIVRSHVLELASDLLAKGLITDATSARASLPPAGRITADRGSADRQAPRFLQEPPSG